MVKVVIGTKLCSFEELIEEYSRVCEENEELKKQISELESEMGRKEEKIWVKEEVIDRQNKVIDVQKELIGNLQKDKPLYIKKPQKYPIPTNEFCCAVSEEPLPFSDEQYEEDLIAELEDRHQQDCITINQLNTTIDTLVDRYAKLRKMKGL